MMKINSRTKSHIVLAVIFMLSVFSFGLFSIMMALLHNVGNGTLMLTMGTLFIILFALMTVFINKAGKVWICSDE